MVENTRAPESDDYVPPTREESQRATLVGIWNGLGRMGNLKWSHYANATVRRDGHDLHFELDWLKYVEDFLPRPDEELPGPSRAQLLTALRRVTDLFGEDEGWPRVEVRTRNSDGERLLSDETLSATLPVSDDDADRVRYARRLLDEAKGTT